MNTEQVKGRYQAAKGKVKDVAGHAVGNKDLGKKGRIEKNVGKVRADVGDLAEDMKGHLS
jgi:uncharacterized protein YjbJ (UPF0337 family)